MCEYASVRVRVHLQGGHAPIAVVLVVIISKRGVFALAIFLPQGSGNDRQRCRKQLLQFLFFPLGRKSLSPVVSPLFQGF